MKVRRTKKKEGKIQQYELTVERDRHDLEVEQE